MRNTPIRRVLAAGASAAIAAAGLAALAPAAQAASEPTDFVCTVSLLGEQPFTVTADTDLPDTVELGSKVAYRMSATVSVPDEVRANARFFFGEEVEGTADIDASVGAQDVPVVATLPRTAVPAETGPLVLEVTGAGTWTPSALGAQSVTVSGFTAKLTFVKGGTPAASPLSVPCVAPTTGPVVVDTVEVVAPTVQATTTTAKVKVVKKTAKATVKVVNADKSAAKGKVKLTLKKGKKVVAKKTVTLKKGRKVVTFKKLAKGKYSLLAQYQGDAGSKKSKKKVTFRVR